MLMIQPESVKFGASVWPDVMAVLVDRIATEPVVEWSDMGPHAVFVDTPRQRVVVKVTRRLAQDAAFTPRPGESAELVVFMAATAADASRRRVRMTCVVQQVTHDVANQRGASQVVTLVAISSDGVIDPIVVEDASDGVV